MLKKIKYGKISVVVFLTVLIWVVADLAKTEEYPVSGAIITVAKSHDPSLLVTFNNKSSVSIDNIVLKGPASKIAQVKRQLNEGEIALKFSLNPTEQEGMTTPGKNTYSLNVLDFLRQSDQIKELGLRVASCSPTTLSVNVVPLVEKSLDVKCVDENGADVKTETIEPPKVDIYVLEDWVGGATVQLTRTEKEQAKNSAIEKIPYVELVPGQIRYASTAVTIKTLPEENQLTDYTITPTLCIAYSLNMQGEYKAEVANLDEVISSFTISATPAAKQAYENQPFQITLYILDDDKKTTGPQRKEVVYNFPQEFLRNKEIKLKGQPAEARFKLIHLSSAKPQPGAEP